MTLHRPSLACLGLLVTTATGLSAQLRDWNRGGVCYEIFVRSFADSDGDGVGDLRGLTERLRYVNDGDPATTDDLGATCIWLMPVAESPSYHGYDVADYYRVDAEYGTAEDFKEFVAEAHRLGIAVLVDMVLNHASSERPSFRAALADPASPYRDWYRFSDTAQGKGPWGMEAWHRSPVRDEWYYGVFWSGMPDLNYATPAVREEAKRIATFWLEEMGVDGFRLDAIPYLVEEDGCLSGCPGTHAYLREYAAHLQQVRPGTYTVGEAWGDVATLLPYYPDQLTAYFAFEAMDSLIATVRHGNPAGLLPVFLRLQDTMPPHRWSPLLSNHDGTRTMTLLGGHHGRARLAATLLLTLPGLPYVYYGEEIGMTGDKPDPRLRTPMQWSPEPGLGFTTGRAWSSAQPDSMAVHVQGQHRDPGSLLNHYRRLIHLRTAHDALAVGELVALPSPGDGVLAYLRRHEDAAVLVIANFTGRTVREVAIDLPPGTLAAGTHAAADLLGGPTAADAAIGSDGALAGYRPLAAGLAPHQAVVLELRRR